MHRQQLIHSLIWLSAGIVAAWILLSPKPTHPVAPLALSPAVSFRPELQGWSDRYFMLRMVAHHEDAVFMADLALDHAKHAEIRTLARSIQTTQTRQIQEMRTWYKQWYGTEIPEASYALDWHPQSVMQNDMAHPQHTTNFDRLFLEEMIPHHQLAVMMAEMVLLQSQRPEIRNLAASIIKTQNAELEQMERWYQVWYPIAQR